jgi:hypothetical protein
MSAKPPSRYSHAGARRSTKVVLNPVMRLAAGRRYRYAAALHHVGRRTGPLHAVKTG